MPGVVITTATRNGPTSTLIAASGQYFVGGLAEKGTTTTYIDIRSMADYATKLGDRVTYGYLFDDLTTFFAEGGARAYVTRNVGASATKGLLTLKDQSASTGLDTLRIDAENPGAWSTRVTVQIRAGTNPASFRLTVYYDGLSVGEDFNNIATPADAVTALTRSAYVRAVDLGSATPPSTTGANNPRVLAATALSAGADDRASVTAGNIVTSLDRFPIELGPGAVAIPGYNTAVHAGIIAHATANRRIGLLAGARSSTVATLTGLANALNSEFVGLFAPHIIVPDNAGGTRVIEPVGFVAAARNKAHERVGQWRAGGGLISASSTLVGVDQTFTRAEGDTLDVGRVNALRVIANTVRVYGWRSLSQDDTNYALLTSRDLLNTLVDEGEKRLEPYVFETIDGRGHVLANVEGALIALCEPIRKQGGLYERVTETGNVLDAGYVVDTGPSVNTLDTLSRNELRARLSVRISPSAGLITLNIVKVAVSAAL